MELPGLLITLIFLLWLFTRKTSKISGYLLLIFILGIYLLSASFSVRWWVLPLENRFLDSYNQELTANLSKSVAVVLSGGVTIGIPSGYSALHEDELEKYTLIRLNKGFELYRRFDVPVLVTGGVLFNSLQIPVAELMAQTLYRWGVPQEKVWIEDRAQTTAENAKLSIALLDDSIQTIFLVTSALHLPRSVAVFEEEIRNQNRSIEVLPIPTDFIVNDQPLAWYDFMPSSGGFSASMSALHEWIGMLFYWIF